MRKQHHLNRKDGLLDRVLARLNEVGLTASDLDDFLDKLGLPNHSYLEVYLEHIGDPDDIRRIAKFLGLSASHLMEVSPCTDSEYARTVCDDLLEHYGPRLEMAPDEVWPYVEDHVELKGESRLSIRNQVDLVLQGLTPPLQHFNTPCDPLGCGDVRCIARCRQTGRHQEL